MRGLYPDSIATMRTGRRVSRDHGETASMQRVVKHLSVGRPTGMHFFFASSSFFLLFLSLLSFVRRLIAHVLFPCVSTQLTFHMTTPDESTVAFLGHVPDSRLVASAAA